jgi:NAD(P)-dependent dehydrogenase (short-subunit alcohol dehydrogenase family)
MSKALATEFTPQGVRSNVVTPGMTRTPLHDRPGGFGDQIAEALGTGQEHAIDQVLQVTGAEWVVDGRALPEI